MDSCPLTGNPNKDDIPIEYKIRLFSLLETSEKYLPDMIKELTFLESIQKKLKDKKERLERGELSDDDINMGASTTSKL